jgi:signal transduction histidine kinase
MQHTRKVSAHLTGRSMPDRYALLLLSVACALAGFSGRLFAQRDAPQLTTAAAVRALKPSEASLHLPVRLRGTVLGEAEPQGHGFVLQDDTAGIYLQGPGRLVSNLRRGDAIEVEGTTDPGGFAPFVIVQTLRKQGVSAIAEPRGVTYEQLINGRLDAQWVEVSGTVRTCETIGANPRKTKLELATGGGRLAVQLNPAVEADSLIDAEVRIRGLCFFQFNQNRQVLSPLLSVPRDVAVIVERPAPSAAFDSPALPINSLLQFAPEGSYGHRVHVRGVVTHQEPGQFIWIRDETCGVRVQTGDQARVQPGDVIDVLGFPNRGDNAPVLDDAVFQKYASGPPPAPVYLLKTGEAPGRDAQLVQLDGLLLDRTPLSNGWSLLLQGEPHVFKALVPTFGDDSASLRWQLGSRVRVTGICSVIRDVPGPVSGVWSPKAFQILLRSPADCVVLVPPSWWTRSRVAWLFGIVVVSSILSASGVMLWTRWKLREQAARRALAEAEFSAILTERNRMAREIHDTLAQGLGAISVQLELAKNQVSAGSAPTGRHLDLAHRMVRSSLADARASIWKMRSQVLEDRDLAGALTDILAHLAGDREMETHMQVAGRPRRLPPVTENNLLRIGQEAITNAAKHSLANRIEVRLEFSDDSVRLCVHDDGRGFDGAKPPLGGFGLVGMQERAAELRSSLGVTTRPGAGTEIEVTVST